MQTKSGWVAKFMPRFNGPYEVVKAHPKALDYTLVMLGAPNIFPTFHASHLRLFIVNDNDKYPSRKLAKPGPIVMKDGSTEYFIERIIDCHPRGHGKQYLV
ncbi:hypothetical protein L208DRAFT_1550065 [Tricholoma matsutake]|nr:hypothetical protein L208DRAFT_1550065 [Tricholoma matsutake 945]